ncbi:MAG: TIR domain-containing protein [Rikenellaceae bacterium]|nr:TIR domain-containing protein [Rikenellaceae bacterium]
MSENRPYDIFISYRRHGGAEYVRPLKAELELRGYNVFLDYDELKDGVFDKRIMDAIEQAPIFVFMLSAHSLDRCVNDDDWVRKEIEFAVSKKRHFVPVNPNKEFDGFPDDVPEQVKQSLGQHQFSHIDFEQLFKSSVREMDEYRIRPILKERLREQPKSSAGARVTIETDLDCRILHFGKQIGTAICGEFPEIRLQKGKHKLTFVGMECDSDRVEQMLTITDLEFGEFIEVKLRDIYNARKAREEAERKAREEAERKAREEAERKARERAERVARMKKYSVGDYYNDGVREGVVFEVSADGRRGKIVSIMQSEILQWASDAAEYRRLIGADSETDGAYNMAKVKTISGWRDKYPPFAWCADLGEGWYLPSKEELLTIYKCKDKLNPRLTDKLLFTYWSSTEDNRRDIFGESYVWDVYMAGGDASRTNKYCYGYVRAVSAF